jgi:hypothetical protein
MAISNSVMTGTQVQMAGRPDRKLATEFIISSMVKKLVV